ncbi:subtilisin-like protease SBT1.8 [Solanum dulcamara]|uniref:subtilisin-like protease SBT1.8 n=1 Tax=Solanum dulcamara TaxID=45834 RepID=UPI002485D0FF|nr:subtilisin-like protease SBT1.8 [Solanum dulcamara]XP_055820665.1 subtilisin-like protease SBT1.8 [Solanum dulcamara]
MKTVITPPQTTRTPEFLGLDKLNFGAGRTLPEFNTAAQDVTIGVLDSGIWPESESFSDLGMSNVPSRWRRKCQSALDFDPKVHCNRKLIAHCSKEIQSPRIRKDMAHILRAQPQDQLWQMLVFLAMPKGLLEGWPV